MKLWSNEAINTVCWTDTVSEILSRGFVLQIVLEGWSVKDASWDTMSTEKIRFVHLWWNMRSWDSSWSFTTPILLSREWYCGEFLEGSASQAPQKGTSTWGCGASTCISCPFAGLLRTKTLTCTAMWVALQYRGWSLCMKYFEMMTLSQSRQMQTRERGSGKSVRKQEVLCAIGEWGSDREDNGTAV